MTRILLYGAWAAPVAVFLWITLPPVVALIFTGVMAFLGMGIWYERNRGGR